jgi:uncharacterized membrane protein
LNLLFLVLTVRGYNLSRQTTVQSSIYGGSVSKETDVIRDLFTKKQALLLELRNYEGNNQFSEISAEDVGQQLAVANQHVGIIPVSHLALSRHTFSFCSIQPIVPLIAVLCCVAILYEFMLFLVYFSGPNTIADWHSCQHGF